MSEIIKFPGGSKHRKRIEGRSPVTGRMSRVELKQKRTDRDEGELTVTCLNGRLRKERKEVWRAADATREYWEVCTEMASAIARAQSHGIPEGRNHSPCEPRERLTLVAKWRQALVQQLLTPAPDTAAISWKRAALKSGQHQHTDVKTERIERAIADDVAFLAAHPTRRSNSEAMAKRREFNEAMRQRIRDIAAARGLSDEEITPALKLKHQEIFRFSEAHGVNLVWLLEGRGRIEKDPIVLHPNMTGAELVVVASTLPEAEQRMIEALLDQSLEERE